MSGPPPRVVVVDYDPDWPRAFERLRARLAPLVGELGARVEHVGSTAVPGLAAKPVIDLDVVVRPDRLTDAIRRLEGLGYRHRGDLGVPGREAFRGLPEDPRHHLYLCPEGSVALANHLAVRDHLRAHPDAARRYDELKRDLAARFPHDVDAYVAGKTPFLLALLRVAGFDRPALAEVARVNAAAVAPPGAR